MRVLIIDADTLRPDHTSPYGYARRITPNVQALADEALVLTEYHAADTPCVPSRANFTTQRFGISNGAFGHEGHDADVRLTQWRSHTPQAPFFGYHLANEAGYHTATIGCFAERHQTWWFHSNFLETLRPTLSLGLDEDARDISNAGIEWLQRRRHEEDWLLHLTYWEPHTDYYVDKSWVDKARAAGPAPAWPDAATIQAHQQLYGTHCAVDLHGVYGAASPLPEIMPDAVRDRDDFERLIDGYDGAIAYWDFHVGRLIDELKRLGLYEDTAIIVTGDHGESFGEQGVYAEHAMAHPACTRVPMIIRWPGLTDRLEASKRVHDGLAYNLDLGPTLCELLGLPVPPGWHGRSFAPLLRGQPLAGRDYLVLSQGVHTFQRAVRMGSMLYLRTLHPGTFPLNPEELYDLAADPNLTRDLMPSQPERAAPLKVALNDWWHQHAGFPGAAPDPMQQHLARGPVLYSDPVRYLARLQATGRQAQAADYRRRLGDFLVDTHVLPDHEKPKRNFPQKRRQRGE